MTHRYDIPIPPKNKGRNQKSLVRLRIEAIPLGASEFIECKLAVIPSLRITCYRIKEKTGEVYVTRRSEDVDGRHGLRIWRME